MSEPDREFGIGRVTRFYVPLLLQAFSQSVTYPLVGGIVTHGPLGVDALTGFAQGLAVMFMIGLLGGGLIATGMVHAHDWGGYRAFRRLNTVMMVVLLAVQALLGIPALGRFVFEDIMNLSPQLAEIARLTLLGGLVMNGVFFVRNVALVVLFNNLESGKANNSTLVRIVFTVACAFVFPRLGWVGPMWGLTAMTLGVIIECVLTWFAARPYVRDLKLTKGTLPWYSTLDEPLAAKRRRLKVISQFWFMFPLSFGSFVLAVSPLAIAAFVGRAAADPQVMLAIHYVTIGVANPVAFAALRLQPVTLAFPPEYRRDLRMLYFAIAAGAVLSLAIWVFSTPAIADSYFGSYQKVKPEHLNMARAAITAYCGWTILQAVRAYIEGRAVLARRPSAVTVGQVTYLLSLVAALAVMLKLSVTGWKMAVGGIYIATSCTMLAVYAMFFWYNIRDGRRNSRINT